MIGSKIRRNPAYSKRVRIDPLFGGGSFYYEEGSIVNWITGMVQSQYIGLVRAGIRIHVGERTSLHVRWPIGQERFFVVGERVIATIPGEAVRLEAGMFRRSKQRWNRWIGRIVLMESGDTGTVVTVKIHGEAWTLKAYGPVVGARQPSKAWDDVNVVVDPQKVELLSPRRDSGARKVL